MANQGLLTIGDILEVGTQQGGNPGLQEVPVGETESYILRAFKLWLHHVYLTYDLPFMETEASVVSTSPTYSISLAAITRYRSINGLFLNTFGRIYGADNYRSVWFRLKEDLSQSTVPTGIPTTFAVSPDRGSIVLWPIPTAAVAGKLLYYRIPDVSGYTTATTAATLDWEDTLALVKAVEEMTRNWDKDNMIAMSMMVAEKMFGQYRVAAEDIGRETSHTVKLNPKWFNYRGGD